MKLSLTLSLACASFLATAAFAQQGSQPKAGATQTDAAAKPAALTAPADADVVRAQKPSYPLKTCVVSGEALGSMGAPLEHVVDGRLVRLCCKSCTKAVSEDKAGVLAKIDKAVVSEQKPGYPLKTCPVSGHDLGADAIDVVHGTRLVRMCCADCRPGFAKDPAAVLAKIDAALIEAQRATYPLQKCPISGEALGADAVDQLYGTQLVRFCCSSCTRTFAKNPEPIVADLQAAIAKAKTPR